MVQTSTIVTASVATAVTGLFAYAVYFDYKRRAHPDFRRSLRRNERHQVRAEKEEAKAKSQHQRQKIKNAVAEAVDAGFPKDPSEREMYFMEQVSKGEVMSSDPNNLFESALAFYKALKVYPSPGDLIGIYDQTVSKQVLDILAELIAADPTLKIGPNAEGPSASNMPPAAGLD